MLPAFDLVVPRSLGEALEALAEGGVVSAPLAGGTNLLVDLRARRADVARLVSLARLDELKGIARKDGHVSLGGRATVSDLLRQPMVSEQAPALAAAAANFGGALVRNAATVAGNVCYGSPAADLVPPLLVMDAEVVLASTEGTRTLPLDGFYLGLRETACRAHELVTEIRWPAAEPGSTSLFYKLGLRKGDAVAVVAVAVALAAEGGKCTRARIALGAVAPVVKRAPAAEALLAGERLTPAAIAEAARRAAGECEPIDDIRASAQYRRRTVEALTRRLLTRAWDAVT